jgi:predicted ribonuclease YlaK
MKNIYLDTNIFLHFRSFEEIGWAEIVNSTELQILIAPTVISELDKHKSNSNSKISKRAKSALKKIESTLDSEQIGELRVVVISTEPKADTFQDNNLEKDVADDRILASILENQEKEESILITNDTGPLIKARRLGILAKKIPQEYELKLENDPIQKENEKLRKELSAFKNLIPKLDLKFTNNLRYLDLHILDFVPEKNKTKEIEKLKLEYPKVDLTTEDSNVNNPLAILKNSPFFPTTTELRDYNNALDLSFQVCSDKRRNHHKIDLEHYCNPLILW